MAGIVLVCFYCVRLDNNDMRGGRQFRRIMKRIEYTVRNKKEAEKEIIYQSTVCFVYYLLLLLLRFIII